MVRVCNGSNAAAEGFAEAEKLSRDAAERVEAGHRGRGSKLFLILLLLLRYFFGHDISKIDFQST